MTFSLMLLVPSWASAGNALLTLNGAWHKVRDDATLRFMMVAAVFYGLTTFEGSFMAIRTVNSLSHYTDWTIGHVHAGALGWVALITFGSIYASVPWLWKQPSLYSARLVEAHFWLALSGLCQGLISPMVFTIGQTLSGPDAAGRWMGVQNLIGNLAGVTAPVITGFIVDATGSFRYAFLIAAAFSVVAVFAWGIVIERVEPVAWRQRALRTAEA